MGALRDHFARGRGDPHTGRFNRLCSLVLDGKPLGDYPLDIARSAEEQQQFEELQWLGIALVGCDADLDIDQVFYIGHTPTLPDFEASTKSGQTVRIELSRVLFGRELQQNNYFAMIAGRAQQVLERSASTAKAGEFIYRVYNESVGAISRKDAERAAAEMATFIENDERLHAPSTTLYAATDVTLYPTLSRLGIHVTHSEDDGMPIRVLWDPMSEQSDPAAAVRQFDAVRSEKARKFSRYSESGKYPVWLAFGAMSLRQHFIALTLVNSLAERDDIDPSPFARILVGCYTAGVTISCAGERPHYTSLTTSG